MNKYRWIYFVTLITLIALASLLMARDHMARETVRRYLKSIDIAEVTYKSAASSFFGDGVILYQVVFPGVRIPHKIDKVVIQKKDKSLDIRMIGINVKVLDALRQKDTETLNGRMRAYRVYDDAFKYPLESLALCGIDDIKFNAVIALTESGLNSLNLTIRAYETKWGEIAFSGEIAKPIGIQNAIRNPNALAFEKITNPVLLLKNKELAKRYSIYAVRSGYQPIPLGNIRITIPNAVILEKTVEP